MIRKMFTTILALVLALMLPLCAMAQTQHTLTIIPGDELASIEALADFLKVFSVTTVAGEKSGALTITLDDTDVATIALGMDETGLYVQSNLLSDDVLYVDWDNGLNLLGEVIKSSMTLNGEPLDAEAAEAIDASMESLKASLTQGQIASEMAEPASPEDVIAMLQAQYPDDPKMVEFVKSIMDKAVEEDGAFTSEAHDAADQKVTVTAGVDELLLVCETATMRNAITQSIAASDSTLTEEQVAEQVDKILQQVREIYQNSGFEMVMTAYTADKGETLISMDMTMKMSVKEEDESADIDMKMDYNRLTADAGVSHKGGMTITVNGEAVLMNIDVLCGSNGVCDGMFGALADGELVSVTYHGEQTGDEQREDSVSVYLRSDAAAVIAPAASERPLITFKVVSAPAAENVLAAIDAADANTAVNVLTLSEEDMSQLVEGVMSRAMSAFYTAMSKMPASVINLMYSSNVE